MKKLFKTVFVLSVWFIYSQEIYHLSAHDLTVSTTADDEFFAALAEASQESVAENGRADEIMDAIINHEQGEMLDEEVSFSSQSPVLARIKQYTIGLAVKSLIYYGHCKRYVGEWLRYLRSCIHGEYVDAE